VSAKSGLSGGLGNYLDVRSICPELLFSMLIFVFSGRKFIRSSRLGHSVGPPRFCFHHLPGAVLLEHFCCSSCRKLVRGIQGQTCSRCYSCLVLHCLLYCHGMEVQIFLLWWMTGWLMRAHSTMFLVFRDHWGKLFNDDPGMTFSISSSFGALI